MLIIHIYNCGNNPVKMFGSCEYIFFCSSLYTFFTVMITDSFRLLTLILIVIHLLKKETETKCTRHKVMMNLTDIALLLFNYRYRNNIVLLNSFGHDNHAVKIGYCDSPRVNGQLKKKR